MSDADISEFQEMMKYLELCPKCKSAYWIFQDEQKKEMIKKGIERR